MLRARTLALAVLVTVASLGLASGLAYRWLLRDARLREAGQVASLRAILRPRGDEAAATLWGLAFLPVFWGGLLTLLSPFLLFDTFATGAFVLPWVVVLVLAVYMRFLYLRPSLLGGGGDEEVDPFRQSASAAWSRHLKVALWCGMPGLVLCTVCVAAAPDVGPIAFLALLSIPPALVGPWIGGLSALPIVARGAGLSTRAAEPTRPGWLPRIAVGAAAVALGGLWIAGAHVVLGPAGNPLLSDEDFPRLDTCHGPLPFSVAEPVEPEATRARLVRAGVSCDSAQSPIGQLGLGDQVLAWCVPSQVEPVLVHFVALDPSADRVLASRELSVASVEVRATSAGVIAVVREPDGGLRLVRIGRDALVDADWRVPMPPGRDDSRPFLEVDSAGDVAFAWQHRERTVGLTWLTSDLVPIGRPAVVSAAGPWSSLTLGKAACLHKYEGGSVALVLDRDGTLRRPALAERLAVRAGSAFHVAWTGVALVVLAFVAARAARTRRRLARALAAGAFAEGTLSPTDEDAAILRRPNGEVVRVRTHGAAWHGFADAEPRQGPCLVVGTGAAAGAGAYRSAPPEIDAAVGLGIVRGDRGQALAWAALHRDRILSTVVVLGGLVTAPALLALWL